MKSNAANLTSLVKKAAMWLLYLVDPLVACPPSDGKEQNIPLWVAIIFVTLELAAIVLLVTAVSVWLFSTIG